MLALTRLAVSAWGCDLERARGLYTAVNRPAITYGAGVIAEQSPRGNSSAVSRALASSQNKASRKVAMGYKASPIRYLEPEMGVPPLDCTWSKGNAPLSDALKHRG